MDETGAGRGDGGGADGHLTAFGDSGGGEARAGGEQGEGLAGLSQSDGRAAGADAGSQQQQQRSSSSATPASPQGTAGELGSSPDAAMPRALSLPIEPTHPWTPPLTSSAVFPLLRADTASLLSPSFSSTPVTNAGAGDGGGRGALSRDAAPDDAPANAEHAPGGSAAAAQTGRPSHAPSAPATIQAPPMAAAGPRPRGSPVSDAPTPSPSSSPPSALRSTSSTGRRRASLGADPGTPAGTSPLRLPPRQHALDIDSFALARERRRSEGADGVVGAQGGGGEGKEAEGGDARAGGGAAEGGGGGDSEGDAQGAARPRRSSGAFHAALQARMGSVEMKRRDAADVLFCPATSHRLSPRRRVS